jgi:nitric oxide reductase activation protein
MINNHQIQEQIAISKKHQQNVRRLVEIFKTMPENSRTEIIIDAMVQFDLSNKSSTPSKQSQPKIHNNKRPFDRIVAMLADNPSATVDEICKAVYGNHPRGVDRTRGALAKMKGKRVEHVPGERKLWRKITRVMLPSKDQVVTQRAIVDSIEGASA